MDTAELGSFASKLGANPMPETAFPAWAFAACFAFFFLMLMGQHKVTWTGKALLAGLVVLGIYLVQVSGVTPEDAGKAGKATAQAIEKRINP